MPPPARGPTAELWETRARRERPDRTAGPASARTRRAPGVHTARFGTSPDVQPARLPACNPRVFRRAERRVSRRAERRVSRRAERRVSRHANGASTDARTSAFSGAQTARLRGVRSVCFLNLSVWTLVWLLCDFSGWATFALNHTQLVPLAGLQRQRVLVFMGQKLVLRGFMQRGQRLAVFAARDGLRPPLRVLSRSE